MNSQTHTRVGSAQDDFGRRGLARTWLHAKLDQSKPMGTQDSEEPEIVANLRHMVQKDNDRSDMVKG